MIASYYWGMDEIQAHQAAGAPIVPDEDLYPTLQRHEAMAALLATEIRNRKARQGAE